MRLGGPWSNNPLPTPAHRARDHNLTNAACPTVSTSATLTDPLATMGLADRALMKSPQVVADGEGQMSPRGVPNQNCCVEMSSNLTIGSGNSVGIFGWIRGPS
jgi:hypothetical protein